MRNVIANTHSSCSLATAAAAAAAPAHQLGGPNVAAAAFAAVAAAPSLWNAAVAAGMSK